MFQSNIISAGKMMAYVLMMFGVLQCAATFTPYVREDLPAMSHQIHLSLLFYSLMSGAIMLFCGILLVVMFGKVAGTPAMGTPVLMVGTFVFIYGILATGFMYRNPFAWMMAILGLAIFVDTLCLKLSFDQGKK